MSAKEGANRDNLVHVGEDLFALSHIAGVRIHVVAVGVAVAGSALPVIVPPERDSGQH